MPILTNISRRAWQTAYRGIVPDNFLNNLATGAGRRTDQLNDTTTPPMPPIVAELGGGIVGYALATVARDPDCETTTTGELAVLNVDPDHWRKGVGRALVAEATHWWRQRNFTLAVLWTLERNQRGRRFYEALGWVADGASRSETLTGFGLPEVRYRCSC